MKTQKLFLHLAYYSIFWIWNLTFLLVVWVGIFPHIAIPLTQAIIAGEIEGEILVPLVGLIGTPTICTIIGAIRFRDRALELMRLFYGVEAPLLLLCLVRLFVLRELTPASLLIVGTVFACIAAFLVELLWGYSHQSSVISQQSSVNQARYIPPLRFHPTSPASHFPRLLSWLQVALHGLMLFVGLYAGVVLLFYAVPVAAALLEEFFSFRWINGFLWEIRNSLWSAFWYIPIASILFTGSVSLFIAMPSALAGLFVHSGQRILRLFSAQYGRSRTAIISLGVVTAWIGLFLVLQNQPQTHAFKLLENPPQTDSERQELLEKSDTIRKGLVNAYLSSYRYLGTWDESNQIRTMYKYTFNLPEPALEVLQASYNQLISPFLYQGDRADEKKAQNLYAQFFDTPLQKRDRAAVLHALKSTAILDDAKAGVLNINQEKVWLQQQAVNITERGDWADVELHEVYRNKTIDVEEIFYSFSLPESAVLTGVWLGDTDDLNKRFPFRISPRGAAQKVYNSQVNRPRPVDPALLEQVGPRQYRLRAFPIPPKLQSRERRNNTTRPTELHLWLTYKVMRQGKGWSLPVLAEKRNIFWTEKTERLRNGKKVKGFEGDWLEASIPATQQPPTQHQVTLDGYQIAAKPLAEGDYAFPENQHFAVILDTSRSMGNHRKDTIKIVNWLKKRGFADNRFANNDADLYLSASTGKEPERIDDLSTFKPKKVAFYGTLQLKDMLRQFAQLKGNTAYDGIILVSDEGSYELSKDKGDVPAMSAPLWVVHLGKPAAAYDDKTLKAIQDSGGGVATDLEGVLQRMATTAKLQNTQAATIASVVDGYKWSVEKAEGDATSQTGFEPLAARMLVRQLSRETDGTQVAQLDAIHAIAKRHKIVTPYSSAIVLVNDEQRKLLAEAEADADRFDRKVEDGNEQLNKPNSPLNATGVPEPGSLIGLGAIALFLVANRTLSNKHRSKVRR
ncbi:TIGR02921 family PEP-CTERM protein [Lusitaniella coriacea LEGE 07157]|uniref:TIGR02921 family PEP-CTERM protein n=1 Tax=Lusitaniella coriacea LEGE 07157 TaxID=945747 RepID=A0A8J7DYU8_9CYAN|nr:TIGR02921 family PEP-CTERM protein [Lusitaniella coriacea]MBE9116276.1 TIGR02921 family PEP-CTERM protein [Lusitaniella coriacea LEGE 07157]